MKKTTASKRSKSTQTPIPPPPRMKWQIKDYARHASFQFILPYEFMLVCKLMEIKPEEVLYDFMWALSCGSWKREGREARMEKAIDYFLSCGYGQTYYTDASKVEMFRELEAIGMLWPGQDAKMKMIDLHAKWRNKYLDYWFRKWFRKPRRKV